MSMQRRLDEIRRIVKVDKRIIVSDLSRQFNVTEETIRRDLDKLEAEGLIARTYGGAVLNQTNTSESLDFNRRAQNHPEAKRTIASLAASVIPANAVVGADASSTVAEALKVLGAHEGITVLTYSIKAIENLADTGIRLISTGGIVNRSYSAFKGSVAQRVLETFNTEYALLSCKALNMNGGAYDSNEEEVELKKRMIEHTAKVVLLADGSKLDKLAFAQLADFDRINMIITDRKPSQKWRTFLENRGVSLLYPQKGEGV